MFYNADGEFNIGKIVVLTFAFIAAIAFTIAFFNKPETKIRPAGNLISLQLHETTFSWLTSVETSEGWYQVQGAVSASKGDAVKIKSSGDSQDVCIESRNETSCYSIR